MLAGLARPVVVEARDGGRHDRCQATVATGDDGESGDDCPTPAVTATQAVTLTLPAPASGSPLPASPTALPSTPRPATTPLASPAETDLRPALLLGAAAAALAALVVSGFRARRRLRLGLEDGTSDPARM